MSKTLARVATKYDLPFYGAIGSFWLGATQAMHGDVTDGLRWMEPTDRPPTVERPSGIVSVRLSSPNHATLRSSLFSTRKINELGLANARSMLGYSFKDGSNGAWRIRDQAQDFALRFNWFAACSGAPSHCLPHGSGLGIVEFTTGAKWLELLKEIVPGLSRVALIFNPAGGAGASRADTEGRRANWS